MNTWKNIMSKKSKDKRHKGLANTLKMDELETIVATVDYFGGNVRLAIFDLKVARYRVFDWLAMGIGGRIGSDSACKVLAYSFLKVDGDIDKFIEDLRTFDYDIDRSWESIKLN